MKAPKLSLLFFLFTTIGFSQSDFKEYYTKFDRVVGLKNTKLSYGILYKENYRTLKENHHYLNSDAFKKGTVTYQNETFYNVPLKYDLDTDQLIVNIKDEFETFSIQLEKSFVTTFSIKQQLFKNTKETGFNEVLFSSNAITLFKKHLKKKKKKTDQSFMYYKFIKESRYVIYYKNAYFKGNKKKDLVKVFPKQKNFIDSYYKTNKEMKKNNFDAFLTQFIQMLSTKLEEVCCN